MDVIERVRTLWTDHLAGRAHAADVAVVAHCDTLRALRVALDDRPAEDIAGLRVDVGSPVTSQVTASGGLRPNPLTHLWGHALEEEVL